MQAALPAVKNCLEYFCAQKCQNRQLSMGPEMTHLELSSLRAEDIS